MNRRNFILSGGIATAGILSPSISLANQPENMDLINDQQKVNFTRDGLDLTSLEYATMLTKMAEEEGIAIDNYSRNGVVADLENKMAEMLGKEKAILMPTGTLANHIAIRKHAGNNKRVIVQAESHLFNDAGDCATTLSGINLIPLGKGTPEFKLIDVENAIALNNNGRVKTCIGAISIESPVRRQFNKMFNFNEIKSISSFAKENNIKMHLDGARLFNACVHSSIEPKEFADLFDTVYISLYKNFNAASGAILAGDEDFIKDLYHMRRMFGGGMPQVWPFAAIANHYLNSFEQDYTKALESAGKLFYILEADGRFQFEKIQEGTNVVKCKVETSDFNQFRSNLKIYNIDFPKRVSNTGEVLIKINPSILRSSPEEISQGFINALE